MEFTKYVLYKTKKLTNFIGYYKTKDFIQFIIIIKLQLIMENSIEKLYKNAYFILHFLIYLDIDENIFSTLFSRDIPFIISENYSQFMDELKERWKTIFDQSNYNNQTKNPMT